jgi:hypothetical protein
MRHIIPILLLAGNASAQSGIDSLGYVVAAFGLMSLLASYQLIYRKNGLDEQIAKRTALLKRILEETREAQDRLNKVRADLTAMDEQFTAFKKPVVAKGSGAEPDKLRKEYWDHMQTVDEMAPTSPDLKKLMEEKADVEHMIELTKSKYLEWSMDEKGFNNIIESYQRRIIELETKINRMKGETNGH